jgi:SAM-dependent methyltransferase
MNIQEYDSLAGVYDHLQQAVDPVAWADYIESLQQKYSGLAKGDGQDGRPILADLGCGTGSFCIEMEKRGYDPIGIDASPRMLEQARAKAAAAGAGRCLFLQQDIARFELFGTVDLIVCLLDTLNHLLKRTDVARLFKLCANYLNPGGLFIFDVLSPDYLSRRLGNNIFYDGDPEQTMLWQNSYSPRSGISRSEILLFTRTADNCYERSEAIVRERLYRRDELSDYIKEGGLELLAVHGDLTYTAARRYDNRHFYICRRPY